MTVSDRLSDIPRVGQVQERPAPQGEAEPNKYGIVERPRVRIAPLQAPALASVVESHFSLAEYGNGGLRVELYLRPGTR
jgi:hypothetical protein